MKYVIWGAGARGRRLLRFLGCDRVAAFIDKKKSLQGTMLDNVPVMSVVDYLKSDLYNSTWVINSLLFLRGQVQEEINNVGITKCLSLQDCPDEFYDYKYEDVFDYVSKCISDGDMCYLYGFNLYSLLISEELTSSGKHVCIVVEDGTLEEDENISHIDFARVVPLNMVARNEIIYWAAREDSKELGYVKNRGNVICDCTNFNSLKSPYCNDGLKQFKDKYKGKRCFIVATGPSLRKEDLDKLHEHGEFCISLNGIYHVFGNTKWRPDVFVMTDPAAVDWKDSINKMDVNLKFISDNNMDFWKTKQADNIYRFHILFSENEQKFSSDITKGVYSSGNVTYCCLQLAVYMGFESIYLLGVDFNNLLTSHFTSQREYHRDTNPLRLVEGYYRESEAKKIHIRGYVKAEEYSRENGVRIFNATRGGSLDVFERCSFDTLL